jgi:hypothetical protein
VCPSAQPVACAPYVCRGDACGTDCALQADCASGFLCKAPRCVAKSDDGAACSSEIECASGFCVDSVCCDSACPGRCEACDAPGSRGV